MVSARCAGSLRSSGSGLPCATSQKLQRLVHLSPIIMKVAVPCEKHSGRLGQEASSQTVTNLFLRNNDLRSLIAGDAGNRIRIQSGFLIGATVGSILTGMRDNFSAPRCLPFCAFIMGLVGLVSICCETSNLTVIPAKIGGKPSQR